MRYISGIEAFSFASADNWYDDKNPASRTRKNEDDDEHEIYYAPNHGARRAGQTPDITCSWEALRKQILQQWKYLTIREVEEAGPNRDRLASLIQRKYFINARLVENYLRNFERALPLM